ncbi:efflux RND transporter permease subunit [Thauera sp. CAU 1555]|uniref:Efflux RND transporter permease subunit n=1 Tax=Thauera sedimentorum TaxID=2767595 RepID=A0ABR9B4J0_9RHOO|nr:efflux RND transporter permease subunit [Thauera sedimentorum]MBC9070366.1 efflux RND transporter permease subunit [Thauera sedimentorum]MBD8501286.1 efflux RND transporter permease subunit [Thauera sedimentorum]
MSRWNASEWGLTHQALVLYAMVVMTLIGLYSYTRLGQSEDPPFTFKVMVVRTEWPGASAEEVAEQVTDKIEKKLQEVAQLDVVRSYSRPGESMVFFHTRDSTPPREMPDVWYQVRKKVGDIRHTLPQGVAGPFFNDEFGDTYGNIFALLGDGVDYAELKRYADAIRAELLKVPDVSKVSFFGEQPQRVYIELSNTKLATFGLTLTDIANALAAQNAVAGSGFFETADERVWLRPDGRFDDLDAVRNTLIRAGGRSFRLGDVAEVKRGFADPPRERMRYMGREALGLGVSMRAGGDIIALGRHLDEAVARVQAQLPLGLSLERVADQPRAVQRSVGEFVKVLVEAVVIVMAVSLLSLGFRTGVVVLIIIPVVLAITFLFMHLFDIGLHKISLGALIIALGLLVDDAIIAVEMMATKMEQGWERARAASFAYVSTAMPMLSGTLVTAAGFLPIATAASSTGEYTRSIFQVTVIALLVSWVAAVLFVPWLGYHLLPDFSQRNGRPSMLARLAGRLSPRLGARLAERAAHAHQQHDEHAIYHTPFYTRFRALVQACVAHRWVVIALTVAIFAASLFVFVRFVPQQFFPDSTRPELLVDLRLAEGVSHQATERAVRRMEAFLDEQPGVENYVAWVGGGSPRFYLPLDQQLAQTSFAQFVVLTAGSEAREALRERLIRLFDEEAFELRGVVSRLENGPPVGFPVQYRVSGPDPAEMRRIAHRVAALMRGSPHLSNVHLDWEEPSKAVRLQIDQDKARLLGVSSRDLARLLETSLQGTTVTEFREGNETVAVVLRGAESERVHLGLLPDLAVPVAGGGSVPLAQLASAEYGFEQGVVWRRNRVPTVTVRASLYDGTQPAQVVARLAPGIDEVRAALPLGYRLETGGAVEESAKGGRSVAAGLPLFLLVVLTVLMLQLQSFGRVILVVLTAPLGMIGVTAFLLLFDKPFGFVAMLGTIALSGMIMRNSVILVDQIRQDTEAGRSPWEAVVESTVRRCRPIVLTAAAAILAMIPLSRSAFFGPMAVAIMGGLLVATLLTLLFLPALYAAWYRLKPDPQVG